jgi:hypothetical protein
MKAIKHIHIKDLDTGNEYDQVLAVNEDGAYFSYTPAEWLEIEKKLNLA